MPHPPPPRLHWDLFCRVVDNFGDLGVCWRLARDLLARGQPVRLWVDEPALAGRMTQAQPGLEIVPWTDPAPALAPRDVVIEAFGCDPPPDFVAAMARAEKPPVWINLEYLSAEPYVVRSHGLPSPQGSGPGAGLRKWFFYPGFERGTGGLLREPDLQRRRQHFDRHAWLGQWEPHMAAQRRTVSLFAYPTAPLEALLQAWSEARQPTWLLVAWGELQTRAQAWLDQHPQHAHWLHLTALPWLTQPDFDHLLWSCDLNLVRGEDSLVRALWAGHPFVWQIYPQHDGAHEAKLQAFIDMAFIEDPALVARLESDWRAWCGLGARALTDAVARALPFAQGDPALEARWTHQAQRTSLRLASLADLGGALMAFALSKLE